MVHLMQREVTFTRYSHTKRTVTEHLNANLFTTRTTNMFFLNLAIDFGYLLQIQLTGQYYHICKLCVEF